MQRNILDSLTILPNGRLVFSTAIILEYQSIKISSILIPKVFKRFVLLYYTLKVNISYFIILIEIQKGL